MVTANTGGESFLGSMSANISTALLPSPRRTYTNNLFNNNKKNEVLYKII